MKHPARSPHPARLAVAWSLLLVVGLLLLLLAPAGSAASASKGSGAKGPGGETAVSSASAAPANAAHSAAAGSAAGNDGTYVHTVRPGQSLASLVRLYLPQTSFMTGSELENAIRAANRGRRPGALRPGEQIIIPGYEAAIVEHSLGTRKDAEIRGIYLTGAMAGSARGLELIRRWRALGGNAIVFDVKDSDGLVNVPFQYPADGPSAGAACCERRTPPIRNLPKFIRFLHSMQMHAIARIAIFRDEYRAQHDPQSAVRSRRTGQPWKENGKLVWTDPSRPEVQKYNLALARFAAESGVDEVQFDYVRFPAEGDQKDAQFAFEQTHPKWQRAEVISDFLAQARAELQPYNVLFSLDVFGVMGWQRPVDLSHTGQDIVTMARYCDVLSPMIYPSHFFGREGYADPGDAPEHFIGESMDKFREITRGSGAVLRPWLQAFGWRTRTYSADYILKQVSVAREKGGIGFLFWNARNDYSKPFAAMTEMAAHPERYFQQPGTAPAHEAAPAQATAPAPDKS
jgi:hypothetical protein